MAKFKENNIELRDGQKLILDTAKSQWIISDGSEATINTPLIGVAPTEDDHLARKDYVDDEITAIDGFEMDPTPAADSSVTGITVEMTAGDSSAFGIPVYLKSDGKLWSADATTFTTMPVVAITAETQTADAAGSFLLHGFVRLDSWAWTVGGLLYPDPSAPGDMTQTEPSTSGDIVQVLGIATHADRIYFCPSLVTSEIT